MTSNGFFRIQKRKGQRGLPQLAYDGRETAVSFEIHLLADYNNSVEGMQEFASRPLRTFKELQATLQIRTAQGQLVPPKVFPSRHLYLEQPRLASLDRQLLAVGIRAYV